MIEEDLQRLVHDLRCDHSIIHTTIDVLESQPIDLKQKMLLQMLTRHLATTQSMLTDLASSKWLEDALKSDNGLLVELNSLLQDLQTKRLKSIPSQNQEQMDSLIHTLLFFDSNPS